MADEKFSERRKCEHCNNMAPMRIVSELSQVKDFDEGQHFWEEGPTFQLLVCPACEGVILRSSYWHDGCMDGSEPPQFTILHPVMSRTPIGLPEQLRRAYEAALRVRSVDANAYAVLMGRLLDMICKDRNAQGDTLDEKLKDLSSKGEIPEKLVGVVVGIRKLRNIGAHADLGELTSADIPILDDLSKAILEYVYSAPHFAQAAEDRFKSVKAEQKVSG